MILCYHKIDAVQRSHWWVTADEFDRHLADLQAYDVVYLDDYDPHDPAHVVISFDGVYANVATFALPLLQKWGYPFELFVIGDHIGADNRFDQHIEPPALFASLEELDRLVEAGGRVQWHSRTHTELAHLDEARLHDELTPDAALQERFGGQHLQWFAYPHGRDAVLLTETVRRHFRGAVAMVEGGNASDRHLLPRTEIAEGFSASRSTVSIIIANYNYGRFLPEAVDSVLRQSGRVHEIVAIDDASTDGSREVLSRYEDSLRLVYNERNLGIVENFRKAVSLTSGDYIAFLGADNRMRSDFVERSKAALDSHPNAAVAYTDMAVFGPRSRLLARQLEAQPTASEEVFVCRFPDPTPERLASLAEHNIMHGSSMYRRVDYERAGGYRSGDRPEDHDLFSRMVRDGRTAVRVAAPVLEYRQHSGEQANTLLAAQLEAAHHRGRAVALAQELESWRTEAQQARKEEQQRSIRLAEVHLMLVAANEDRERLSAEEQARSIRLGHVHGMLVSANEQLAAQGERIAALEAELSAARRGLALRARLWARRRRGSAVARLRGLRDGSRPDG